MPEPTVNPGILKIKPYVGGEADIEGQKDVIKLSSNEGALGPSPNAITAFEKESSALHRYPDGNATLLRETIAATHNLDSNQIVCGAGSDELIALLCKAFSGPGDEVLYSQYGFLMYSISAMASGAAPKAALEENFTANVDSLLRAVTENTKLLFLANPNNPTGTYLKESELSRLHSELPKHVILVIDAAYAEFVTKDDYVEGNKLVRGNNNVIVTRTFSKSHGLGSLRLGWAYGSPFIIDILNRIRGPFNVSAAGQAAGIASMKDKAFSDTVRNHNSKWLRWTKGQLSKLGVNTTDSVGNFLLLTFNEDSGVSAGEIEAKLKKKRILVRSLQAYGLPNCLRISVGLESEMRTLVDAMSDTLGDIDGKK